MSVHEESFPPRYLVERVLDYIKIHHVRAGIEVVRQVVLSDKNFLPELTESQLRLLHATVRAQLWGNNNFIPILSLPRLSDIVINGYDHVWIDRGFGCERVSAIFNNSEEIRQFAQRNAIACGKRLDGSHPWFDGHLPDGSRIHAISPPLVSRQTHVSIRLFSDKPFSLAELVSLGTISKEVCYIIEAIIKGGLSFIISGGTGTGKTTLLNSLLHLVPSDRRIIVLEDTPEIRPDHPHVVNLYTQSANIEGRGEFSLKQLLRQSLRMNPDVIVLGECRGEEIVDLFSALNTGHEGGAGTLHAQGIQEIPSRIQSLVAGTNLPCDYIISQFSHAVDSVIHLKRSRNRRYISDIAFVNKTSQGIIESVWNHKTGFSEGLTALRLRLLGKGVQI